MPCVTVLQLGQVDVLAVQADACDLAFVGIGVVDLNLNLAAQYQLAQGVAAGGAAGLIDFGCVDVGETDAVFGAVCVGYSDGVTVVNAVYGGCVAVVVAGIGGAGGGNEQCGCGKNEVDFGLHLFGFFGKFGFRLSCFKAA